ncbi:cytochrome P450 3A5, partial [Trichonephila inaurata madagascariensis]
TPNLYPDLLRDIFVKDFHIFPYRRDMVTGDPLGDKSVASLSGEDWKRIRTIITPAFTSRRMRQMGSIINECSETVLEVCEKHCERDEPVDCKRVFGAFTMDVIASSAFGTKIDSHNDPGFNSSRKSGERVFGFTFLRMMLFSKGTPPLKTLSRKWGPTGTIPDLGKGIGNRVLEPTPSPKSCLMHKATYGHCDRCTFSCYRYFIISWLNKEVKLVHS